MASAKTGQPGTVDAMRIVDRTPPFERGAPDPEDTDKHRPDESLRRILLLGSALSLAVTPADVARGVCDIGLAHLGICSCWVVLLRDGELETLHCQGYPSHLSSPWGRFPVTDRTPLSDAFRRQQAVWLDSPREIAARYPGAVALAEAAGDEAWVAIPLVVAGQAVGALGLGFSAPCHATPDEREFIEAVAQQAGQALLRASKFDEEQTARKESEERFRLLAETIPQLIFCSDSLGHVTYVNQRFTDYTGISSAGTLAGEWAESVHPDDVPRVIDLWRRVMPTGETWEMEYRLRRAEDGAYRWFLGRSVAGRGANGEVRQWFGTATDIHDRKIATEERVALLGELERSSRFMTQLQAITAALSQALTAEEVAAIAIREGLAALGAARGLMLRIIEPPKPKDEDKDKAEAELTLHLVGQVNCDEKDLAPWKAGVPLSTPAPLPEIVRTRKAVFLSSREAWLSRWPEALPLSPAPRSQAIALLPLVFDRKVLGALTFGFQERREIAAHEQAFLKSLADQCGQALERARIFKQMQEAIVLRDDFLSIAGHELNTPLAALQLNVQGLQRLANRDFELRKNDRLNERLERCGSNIDRLRRFIDQLLDVSRIASGRLLLERESLDLSELVMEVMGRLAEAAARAGCSVDMSLHGRQVGNWDRMRLEQVVTNLVGNALKYGSGKPLGVEVFGEGQDAVLRVTDQGIGIDPASQERIFGRFERAVSLRNFGGLGLGLWIVRRIVEESGGGISVRSAPGAGSAFTVRLPLATDAAVTEGQQG